MTPIFFGPRDRTLFAAYHPAEAVGGPTRGVVLFAPFGQEAIRTHRLYRVLAERLARVGIAVLRPDFYGTGDSGGGDVDADLEGWQSDVLAAHHELRCRSGAPDIAWMGGRLGGTVALQAAAKVAIGESPRGLVVLDPIVDGSLYLKELREKHVAALLDSYSVADPAWERQLANDPHSFNDEAIGFELPARMREQLRAVIPAAMRCPPALELTVVAAPTDTTVQAWLSEQRSAGATVDSVLFAHSLVWTSDDSLNSALVPAEVLQCLMRLLER